MAWRKKELIYVRALIHKTKNLTLCKLGIALLSAHFEGFIKKAANYYVVYVSSQNIKLAELRTNFVAIQLRDFFKLCSQSDKITVCKDAVDEFLTNYPTFKFEVHYSHDCPLIKTKSNPSSNVVKDICNNIGLDFSQFETKKQYIDTDLLSNRHAVVHGDKITVNISDFDKTFQIITEIMSKFSEQILDAAQSKRYLKT